VLRYVDGQLRQVTLDGEAASLSFGGGLSTQFFWSCDPPTAAIVQREQRTDDGGQTYQGEVRRYQFAGSTLELASRSSFSIGADEPVPDDSGEPGCGLVDLNR
jgi:hypothetical protein